MSNAQPHPVDDFNITFAKWIKAFQEEVTARFEALEPKGARFEVQPWEKGANEQLQGHGEMRVMRGEVFEKVGVNFSHVTGTFNEAYVGDVPGARENGGKFWACGVSLVAHMANPYVPAVHMNLRRIETARGWFGGGADLTPYYPFEEDTALFHGALKDACDAYGEGVYAAHKAQADAYFYLPHRQEPRGVGGTFFDKLDSGDLYKDFQYLQDTGNAFLESYTRIVARRKDTPFTEQERAYQLMRRGRYVEFNLLHDRGTKFGFQSGGNAEAILMSMPPVVTWP